MIRLETRTNECARFRVYFDLLEETVSQNFKERKTYIYRKNKVKYNEGIEYDFNNENLKRYLKRY